MFHTSILNPTSRGMFYGITFILYLLIYDRCAMLSCKNASILDGYIYEGTKLRKEVFSWTSWYSEVSFESKHVLYSILNYF